jgi:hypothetical protein
VIVAAEEDAWAEPFAVKARQQKNATAAADQRRGRGTRLEEERGETADTVMSAKGRMWRAEIVPERAAGRVSDARSR